MREITNEKKAEYRIKENQRRNKKQQNQEAGKWTENKKRGKKL